MRKKSKFFVTVLTGCDKSLCRKEREKKIEGMNEKQDASKARYEQIESKLKVWRQENPKATLTEIEETIDRELEQLRRAMVEEVIEESKAKEGGEYHCPQCQRLMVKNGQKKRKLKTKGGARIELEREQMRCLECGTTLFPPG
jgi:hypothetical protein